jgi:hypothetical protein
MHRLHGLAEPKQVGIGYRRILACCRRTAHSIRVTIDFNPTLIELIDHLHPLTMRFKTSILQSVNIPLNHPMWSLTR